MLAIQYIIIVVLHGAVLGGEYCVCVISLSLSKGFPCLTLNMQQGFYKSYSRVLFLVLYVVSDYDVWVQLVEPSCWATSITVELDIVITGTRKGIPMSKTAPTMEAMVVAMAA
jgi:hypothetical protein